MTARHQGGRIEWRGEAPCATDAAHGRCWTVAETALFTAIASTALWTGIAFSLTSLASLLGG